MKKIAFIIFIIINLKTVSQNVAISTSNTAPFAGAMLDIVSTDKGLLIPRVALTAINVASPISSPTISLMVYNTTAASSGATAVYPGYYYWDGAKWVAFNGNGGKDWALLGNGGTTAGTNFLGTTDAIDLVLKTNNTEAMRILSGGNVGIANPSPSEKLDVTGNIRFSNALMPNNLPGTTGQVLVSQGANTAPVWRSPSNIIKTFSTFATRTLIPASGSGTGWVNVTGLSQAITTTGAAILIITTYGSIENRGGTGAGCGAEVKLQQNGADIPNAYQTIDVNNTPSISGTIGLWSFQTTVSIPSAGTYTFTVQAHKYLASFANFYAGGNSTAPVASQNQGALIIQEFDQ